MEEHWTGCCFAVTACWHQTERLFAINYTCWNSQLDRKLLNMIIWRTKLKKNMGRKLWGGSICRSKGNDRDLVLHTVLHNRTVTWEQLNFDQERYPCLALKEFIFKPIPWSEKEMALSPPTTRPVTSSKASVQLAKSWYSILKCYLARGGRDQIYHYLP